jgi:hypothetical protein
VKRFRIPGDVKKEMRLGIYLNELAGNKCANAIGLRQAKKLIKPGSSVSFAQIKKMNLYLKRASVYYDRRDRSKCGTISYLLWGAKKAYYWSNKILKDEKRYAQ